MKNNKLLWIVTFIPLFLSAIAVRFMPDKVPAHYDFAGNIDRWGSKYEIFIFPVMIIIFTCFWLFMIKYYEKKSSQADSEKKTAEMNNNVKILRTTAIATTIGFGIMHAFITLMQKMTVPGGTTTAVFDVNIISNLIIGSMMVVMGNYMPKSKRNGLFGFRTPKTMSDDVIWYKANRFAGIVFIISGLICVLAGLIIGGIASSFILLGILFIDIVICMVYLSKL